MPPVGPAAARGFVRNPHGRPNFGRTHEIRTILVAVTHRLPGAELAWQPLLGEPDPAQLTELERPLFLGLGPPRRRLEWWAGRVAAHAALAQVGAPELSVLRREDGAPRLVGPGADDYAVAITHGRRHAAALAARRDAPFPFVGLDLVDAEDEPRIARLAPRVFRAEERALFADDPLGNRLGWGSKEAIAKATQTGMFVFALGRAQLVALSPLTSNLSGVVLDHQVLPDGGLLVVAGATAPAKAEAQRLAGISP